MAAQHLFGTETPALGNVHEGLPRTVATTITFAVNGYLTGGRFFAPTTIGGTFELVLYRCDTDDTPANTGAGTLLAAVAFGTLTPGAWNSANFVAPVAVTTGVAYRIGVRTSDGRYTATGGFFNSSLVNGDITGIQTGTDPVGIGLLDNGNFGEDITSYPNRTFNGNCYFVDPTLVLTLAGETGTAALTLPALTFAAAGITSATGTASAVLPPVTGSAAGVAAASGTVAGTLPTMTGTATGAASAAGTCAVALPPVAAAAMGGTTIPAAGTASILLPVLSAAVAGTSSGQPGYADPELLIAAWLHQQTGIRVWADPDLPGNERFTAAIAHLQRAPGSDDLALTLDDVLLDIDVYAATAEHARNAANLIWSAMTFQLPRHTFSNGVFVTRSTAQTRPCWAPDPKLYRRTAAYRVILHGLI